MGGSATVARATKRVSVEGEGGGNILTVLRFACSMCRGRATRRVQKGGGWERGGREHLKHGGSVSCSCQLGKGYCSRWGPTHHVCSSNLQWAKPGVVCSDGSDSKGCLICRGGIRVSEWSVSCSCQQGGGSLNVHQGGGQDGIEGKNLLLLSGRSENAAEKNERERVVERLVMNY